MIREETKSIKYLWKNMILFRSSNIHQTRFLKLKRVITFLSSVKTIVQKNFWISSIIYYIADLPLTRLRLLTNKSNNIAVPYASLWSLILLLSSSSFAFLTRFYKAGGMLDSVSPKKIKLT